MKRRFWTDEETARLVHWYPCMSTPLLACLLQRSECSIYAQASLFGLKKTAFYNAIELGRQGQRLRVSGASSRFCKGLTPWNKGTHWTAGGRSAETRFKKGNKPHTWNPVGHERVSKEGFLQRKVSDTGYTPRDYKPVHIIVWEAINGPVPRGHVVTFIDKNRRNFGPANLECITRAENMRRNSYHRYPQPIPQLIQLRGALQRQINRRAS
jgi:hypothetical protein